MDAEHLSEVIQTIGEPSMEIIRSNGVYLSNFFDTDSGSFLHSHVSERPDLREAIRESIPSTVDDPEATTDLIYDFITSALTWDPNHRPSAADLLHHPWLVERYEQLYTERMPVIEPAMSWDLPRPKNPCGV
eukprot:TRINITY_DN1258_c0_g1_i3.p1 TRINITY_DN1258_c0_g1~~TRINITY_DN1258_c0_g1_i3.p1  ORF type:complete len:132 (+),score=5.21 TRINITY_DN1258_c0_g1_i3:54-449(+)